MQEDSSVVALATSADAVEAGQSVTFTATVTASSGMPTGTITFEDGTTVLALTVLCATSAGAQASFTTSGLAIGSHAITAIYSGDNSFNGNASVPALQTVSQDVTTTTLSSSAPLSTANQSVTFTAVVTGSQGGTPTGTITFEDGNTVLDTATLSACTGGAQATYTTSGLAAGPHAISAIYSGDSTFAASTSAELDQTVSDSNAVGSSTVLSSSTNLTAPTPR